MLSRLKLCKGVRSLPFPIWVTGNSCPLPTVTVSPAVGCWCKESWVKSGEIWSDAPMSVSQLWFKEEPVCAAIELAAIEASLAGGCLPW